MSKYEVRQDVMYTETHEWIKLEEENIATIGITDYAQQKLHEIVYVEFTKGPGDQVSAGDTVAIVESIKTSAEVYTPIGGEIVEVNTRLEEEPELINNSPYDDGWIVKIKSPSAKKDLEKCLSPHEYEKTIAEEK